MRLIDADELYDEMLIEMVMTGFQSRALSVIVTAPTIDPIKHGHWEVIDAEEPRRYGCSECKRLSWYMENYCPECGAKMDGGDENETD